MSKSKILGFLVLLASGFAPSLAWGDSIVLGGGESWSNLPGSIANPGPGASCGTAGGSPGTLPSQCGFMATGPYWDNDSGKGVGGGNVGYFLSAAGLFAGGTNYNPLQYLSQSNAPGQPNSPTSISLDHTSANVFLTLLGDSTEDKTDVFGVYDAADTTLGAAIASEQPVYGPGSMAGDVNVPNSLGIAPGEDYGFYLTRCIYTGTVCTGTTTWFSNAALDATDGNDQHFVIFDSATTGLYYIGIEDWGLYGTSNNGEGNGDFSDIVFALNTNTPPAPEPATLGLLGVGLLGMGFAGTRARGNRA